jgi:glycosyltransferase involved in cell wall biosynthesis
MPKVSVIIPSYNHDKYIAQAIQSVLDQTYQDFEIVIVDDGSSDNSVGKIRQFTDERIRLFCFEINQGACLATKKLIEEAQGEYIALLNSDDIFLADKLQKQVAFLDHHCNIGAVFGYARIIDENNQPYEDKNHPYYQIFRQPNRSRYEWLRYFFYYGNCLCHPSVLIRKECYDKVGLYDPRYRQLPDFDFWVRLCTQYEIHIIQEELIEFRVRAGEENTSGIVPDNLVRQAFEHTRILNHYLKFKSPQDLLTIFNHWQLGQGEIDSDIIPFYLAQEALQQPQARYWLFGLSIIHQLLEDAELSSKLENKYNFSYNDFYKEVANHDVFNLFPNHYTCIYLDSGNGFSEATKISQKSNFLLSQFKICFTFERVMLKAIRWDPTEGRLCRVKIDKIIYKEVDGQVHDVAVNQLASNGYFKDGIITFETVDPWISCSINAEIKSFEICGNWEFVDIDEFDHIIQRKHETIEEKIQELKEKNHELDSIYQSRAWILAIKIRKIAIFLRRIVNVLRIRL